VGPQTGEEQAMTASRLGPFIQQNLGAILSEWEVFAQTRIPQASTMSTLEVRDHAEDMLRKIAEDLGHAESPRQRDRKSKGLADATDASPTAASQHGAVRHLSGFDLVQMFSEFRALRAAVLRRWSAVGGPWDMCHIEDVTRFNESIDQALAESVAAYSAKIDESRDTFLAVLGHDLRGPLASLANCIELQGDPRQSQDARERVRHIATRCVDSMSAMIRDLLEYTRTRLGRGMEVSPRPEDVGALCEATIEEMRLAHPRAHFDCASGGNVIADVDLSRMHQVLLNLLNNAVQHGDLMSPIALVVAQEVDHLSVVVRNQGVPIPADELQVIFNPLVQVAESKSEAQVRPSTSLGLGLFIAREIVLAHGGTIEVSSTVEAGTAFAIRLPKHRGQGTSSPSH
jgi:signal transduction histidine kinase